MSGIGSVDGQDSINGDGPDASDDPPSSSRGWENSTPSSWGTKRDHGTPRGIQGWSGRQGGPWEDLGWQEPAREGKGPAWAGEVAQRKAREGHKPAGANWSGQLN